MKLFNHIIFKIDIFKHVSLYVFEVIFIRIVRVFKDLI